MIFTQVFGPVTKEGADWTRWDYKTAAGDRYAHFNPTQEIPLNTDVAVELSASGSIKSWKATGGDLSAGNPQVAQVLQEVQQGAYAAPTGSQRDFKAEAEGKTRCALVSALLPAMFAALPEGEQGRVEAEVLLDWAFGYVFQTDAVPF